MGSIAGYIALVALVALGVNTYDVSGTYAGVRVRRSANWNDVTDVLLRHSARQIARQGKSRVALPDIHEDFSKKKGFIRLKGKFTATGGWLENFASLGRVGDVTVRREGYASIMTAVLGLSDLRLGYDRYVAEFWGHGPDGTLEGSIGKNAIQFVIKFDVEDGACRTSLQDLRVIEFDDFTVKVSGLGSFDWLAEKVAEWMTNKRRDDIKESIERQVREQVEKALEDFECDEYAGLMIPI